MIDATMTLSEAGKLLRLLGLTDEQENTLVELEHGVHGSAIVSILHRSDLSDGSALGVRYSFLIVVGSLNKDPRVYVSMLVAGRSHVSGEPIGFACGADYINEGDEEIHSYRKV